MAIATEERQEVRAVAKWVRLSPQKARVVLKHIRGRSVPEARTVLAFTPRVAAREIEKVLRSAVANAEENHGLSGNDLVVATAVADVGPVLKRWKARARGRVGRIRKPTCHITITLVEAERRPEAPRTQPKAPETTAVEATAEEKAEVRRRKPAKKKEVAS
jgi:large subunit ribosomal protein L22